MATNAPLDPADTQSLDVPAIQAGRASAAARLICVNPRVLAEGCSHVVIPLQHTRVSIGRSGKNDVVLEASGVSRAHAMLSPGEQGWQVQDMNSANGVLVNKTAIQQKWLATGDVITLGAVHYKFSLDGPGVVTDADQQVSLFDVEKTLALNQQAVTEEVNKTAREPKEASGQSAKTDSRGLLLGMVLVFAAAAVGYLVVG